MSESTINERLNFLITHLGMSVRAFSHAIGASDTNTRNYLSKGVKPNSDYLEKIIDAFKMVNPGWLITGYGEPFFSKEQVALAASGIFNSQIESQSALVSNFTGPPTIEDCEKELANAKKEIKLLTSQLADKEHIIKLLEQLNT